MIKSDALKASRTSETGMVMDLGLGRKGVSFNKNKKERKEMLKDIDNDVQKFMQDFEENKVAAVNDNLTSAMDDSVS